MSFKHVAFATLLVTLASCSAADSDSSPDAAAWRLVEGGWLLDVEAGERVRNPGVLISPDGRIAQVGSEGTAAPAGVEPERLTLQADQTLLPGLIDLHAH